MEAVLPPQVSRHNAAVCPSCGKTINAAGQVAEDGEDVVPPSAGCYAVCFGCAAVLCYERTETGNLYLRATTICELSSLDEEQQADIASAVHRVRWCRGMEAAQ